MNAFSSKQSSDSPIYYLGPYSFNGRFDARTIRVLPQDGQNYNAGQRRKRQVGQIKESFMTNLEVNDLIAENINGIPVNDFLFLENHGELNVSNKDVILEDNVLVGNFSMLKGGRVNGIDLSHEVLAIDSQHLPQSLTFENVKIDYLTVDKLNDIPVDASSLHNTSVNFDDSLPTLSAEKASMQHNLQVVTINGVNWNEFTSKIMS